MEDFLKTLCTDATHLGATLDDEACNAISGYAKLSKVAWDAGGPLRNEVESRCRKVVIRAIMAARGQKLDTVTGALMRTAIAETEPK